jgi:hypothetical protein
MRLLQPLESAPYEAEELAEDGPIMVRTDVHLRHRMVCASGRTDQVHDISRRTYGVKVMLQTSRFVDVVQESRS